MSKFKIEKKVPIPEPSKSAGSPEKYPYSQMKPGDSFFVPAKRICTTPAGKRHGITLVTRKVEEAGVKGFRVWRIK